MTEVISIRFKRGGKQYFFDPQDLTISPGQNVIVETSKGLEMGECVKPNHLVPDDKIVPPLRPLIRLATEEDLLKCSQQKAKESDAFKICQEKIIQHSLEMKLVDVEYNFEGTKIIFFFTADGRIDFRDLVKDLASIFRTRIELRQIGVRDEAKMLGGLGVCGRPFCCNQFLDDFQPVSTKMAKTQSMSLNPAKISGSCGRLMCCLRYEQDAYEDLIKKAPKNGTFVETPSGFGDVTHVNILRQKVKVKIDSSGGDPPKDYAVDEIAVIPGGRPPEGQEPVSILPKAPVKPLKPGYDDAPGFMETLRDGSVKKNTPSKRGGPPSKGLYDKNRPMPPSNPKSTSNKPERQDKTRSALDKLDKPGYKPKAAHNKRSPNKPKASIKGGSKFIPKPQSPAPDKPAAVLEQKPKQVYNRRPRRKSPKNKPPAANKGE